MKFGVILNAGLSAMNDENNYFSRALGEKFLIQSSINKGNEIDAAV